MGWKLNRPRWLSRRRLALCVLAIVFSALGVDAARLDIHGPAPTYLLLDRNSRFIAEIGDHGDDFGYWPQAELPARMVAAVCALEDRRFQSHPGVDPLAMGRAL